MVAASAVWYGAKAHDRTGFYWGNESKPGEDIFRLVADIRRRTSVFNLPVDLYGHFEIVRVTDFIKGHEIGAELIAFCHVFGQAETTDKLCSLNVAS